ncbi:MAG: uroporphyrinogen decarboxylase family protein [Victivallales bacterium]
MKDQMTTRERFQAVSSFKTFDRLPIIEWAGWWDKTIERWRSEGLPSNLDRYDLYRHFGMDVYYQDWVCSRAAGFPAPAHHGAGFIKSERDYEALKKYLYPENCVNAAVWEKWAPEHRRGDCVTWFTLDGFFWFPRTLFGIEEHLYAFYDHPELMHRINRDLAEHHLKIIDSICQYTTPDFMTFGEDMSYNHGPMLSKELFDEFMKPYYQMVIPKLKERGIRVIIDSDGDISVPNSWFEEAGIEGILPLERQAGVDIAQLRRDHPRQIYIGAYDKMVMSKGEAAMREEFERLLPVAAKGGFLISCDHQTPPGVSLDNYKIYLRLFHEYAEKAGSL